MPGGTSASGNLAELEERIIERAIQMELAMIERISAATPRPVGSVERRHRDTDALLASGDSQTRERLQSYRDYMTQGERDAIDRRAEKAGGQAVF